MFKKLSLKANSLASFLYVQYEQRKSDGAWYASWWQVRNTASISLQWTEEYEQVSGGKKSYSCRDLELWSDEAKFYVHISMTTLILPAMWLLSCSHPSIESVWPTLTCYFSCSGGWEFPPRTARAKWGRSKLKVSMTAFHLNHSPGPLCTLQSVCFLKTCPLGKLYCQWGCLTVKVTQRTPCQRQDCVEDPDFEDFSIWCEWECWPSCCQQTKSPPKMEK